MENKPLADMGIINPEENKIKSFLNEIYKISPNNDKEWKKRIIKFFSENKVVPYFIIITEEENKSIINIKKRAFMEFYTNKLKNNVVFIDFENIQSNLIRLKESLDTGSKIKDFGNFLFTWNVIIRKTFSKPIDKKDSRFKKYAVSLEHCSKILKNKERKQVRNYFFMIPDNTIVYPIDKYSKKVDKIVDEKLDEIFKNKRKKKNKSKNSRKRDPISSKLRHECFKKDNYTCVECGKTNKETVLHTDHIVPVSQGGEDELDNLQTLCRECNQKKYNRCWKGGKND